MVVRYPGAQSYVLLFALHLTACYSPYELDDFLHKNIYNKVYFIAKVVKIIDIYTTLYVINFINEKSQQKQFFEYINENNTFYDKQFTEFIVLQQNI